MSWRPVKAQVTGFGLTQLDDGKDGVVLITIENLKLAQFGPGDLEDLYRIRNARSVREYMADSAPISYTAHVEWVNEHLVDSQEILLLMARLRGQAIGFTLLKRVGEEAAEIGVIFREADRHLTIPYTSAVATLYCAFCHLGLAYVVSYVLPVHHRAVALNRSFGAWEVESEKNGMRKFRLSREICLGNSNYLKVLSRIEKKMRISGSDYSFLRERVALVAQK